MCRNCAELNYASQQKSGMDKKRLKMERIIERELGYTWWRRDDPDTPIQDLWHIPKPPYMRWKKYERIMKEFRQLQKDYEREFWVGLSKICYAKDIAEMAIRQLDRLRKQAQGGAAAKTAYYNCLTKKCVLYFGYGKTIEPKAALLLLYFAEGSSSPPDERKEGDAMYVTYQDLIQIGILVVALANLIYQIYKGKKKQPPLFAVVTADRFQRKS